MLTDDPDENSSLIRERSHEYRHADVLTLSAKEIFWVTEYKIMGWKNAKRVEPVGKHLECILGFE